MSFRDITFALEMCDATNVIKVKQMHNLMHLIEEICDFQEAEHGCIVLFERCFRKLEYYHLSKNQSAS